VAKDFFELAQRSRRRQLRRTVESRFELVTLVDLLRWRAIQQSQQRAYTFLINGEKEGPCLTYAELDCQARSISALLQQYKARGERALLLYPPGLEFITAFCSCLYAGVIAIPAPPPDAARLKRTLPWRRIILPSKPLPSM